MNNRPSKAEKRRQRQEERSRVRKDKIVRLPNSLLGPGVKSLRIAQIPELESKKVRYHEQPIRSKTIYVPTQLEFSSGCNMTWCTSISDVEGEWSWRELREWSDDEWNTQIVPGFESLQKSTWSELLFEQKVPAKGGKLVPKHHHQELSTLVREAQERWIHLGLEEYDTAFRFRFANTVRAWGIKLEGHFYLVWWERYHQVYPV